MFVSFIQYFLSILKLLSYLARVKNSISFEMWEFGSPNERISKGRALRRGLLAFPEDWRLADYLISITSFSFALAISSIFLISSSVSF
jgi:hypothetical protein